MQRAPCFWSMASSACSWNSCQSWTRSAGGRASGSSRGYSMKPVGLPMSPPSKVFAALPRINRIFASSSSGSDVLRDQFLPRGHHVLAGPGGAKAFGHRPFFRLQLGKRQQQPIQVRLILKPFGLCRRPTMLITLLAISSGGVTTSTFLTRCGGRQAVDRPNVHQMPILGFLHLIDAVSESVSSLRARARRCGSAR